MKRVMEVYSIFYLLLMMRMGFSMLGKSLAAGSRRWSTLRPIVTIRLLCGLVVSLINNLDLNHVKLKHKIKYLIIFKICE